MITSILESWPINFNFNAKILTSLMNRPTTGGAAPPAAIEAAEA